MFPEELPKRLIKMFSFVGENILDPFAGSGTTLLVAKKLDRNSIGYEINQEFIPIIQEKLGSQQTDMDGTSYTLLKQNTTINFETEIEKLPYIFKEPHTLDKKVDLKKLQYGSKIDKDSSIKREELYTVKEVISPEKLLLGNGLIVKLIGVKENPIINGKATSFLIDKTKGKKVFIRYDAQKYDSENNLMCYLYLENKTFINAHLIKNGLVQVDNNIEFKYKEKFFNLQQ